MDPRRVPAPDLQESEFAGRCLASRRGSLSLRRRRVRRLMPRLGAHLSIAGGLPRALDRARASRCEALQIFTKSVGQWRARPLPDDEVAEFRAQREALGIPAIAHNSYLI